MAIAVESRDGPRLTRERDSDHRDLKNHREPNSDTQAQRTLLVSGKPGHGRFSRHFRNTRFGHPRKRDDPKANQTAQQAEY